MKNAIEHYTEIFICSEEGKFRELTDIEQDQAAKKKSYEHSKKIIKGLSVIYLCIMKKFIELQYSQETSFVDNILTGIMYAPLAFIALSDKLPFLAKLQFIKLLLSKIKRLS